MSNVAAPRPAKRRIGGWLLVAVGLLVVLLAAGLLWLRLTGARGTLESLINDAVGPATGGLYRVHIGDASIQVLAGTIWLADVRLEVSPDVPAGTARPALEIGLEIPAARIEGVRLLPLVLRTGLIARRIEVTGASVHGDLFPDRATAPAVSPTEPEPGSAAETRTREQQIQEALEGIPEIRLVEIRLLDASGRFDVVPGDAAHEDEGENAAASRVADVDFEIDGLRIHAGATVEERRALFSRDIRLTANDLELGDAGGTRVGLERLTVSVAEGAFEIAGFRLEPAIDAEEYLKRAEIRESDRIALWVGRARASGIEWWRLIADLAVDVERFEVAGFRLDILHDKAKPPGPPRTEPAKMPHDALRDLGIPVAVDEIALSEGYVSYSEHAAGAARPGTLTFEEIHGTVRNVSNEPERMTAESPAIAEITTLVAGAAPLTLQLTLPLLEAPPTMHLVARVAAFDAGSLNALLVPLLGAKIASGQMQGLDFDIRWAPGRATGELGAFYRDLRVQLVDRDTGGKNVGQSILSFVANRIGIRGSNPDGPGKAPRTGAVDTAIDPTWPFFKALWFPVRDGFLDLIARGPLRR